MILNTLYRKDTKEILLKSYYHTIPTGIKIWYGMYHTALGTGTLNLKHEVNPTNRQKVTRIGQKTIYYLGLFLILKLMWLMPIFCLKMSRLIRQLYINKQQTHACHTIPDPSNSTVVLDVDFTACTDNKLTDQPIRCPI